MLNNNSLWEIMKPIVAIAPVSAAASSTKTGTCINMAKVEKLGILLQFGAGAGTIHVTVEQCTAAAGTGAKALAFTKVDLIADNSSTAATGMDPVETAVVANSFDAVTLNTVYIDIDPSKMDADNSFTYLRVKCVEFGGAAAIVLAADYLVKVGRYTGRSSTGNLYV